jgi:superfamily II RNA helicase
MKKRWFVFFIVSLCIFTADISTKYIIEKKLPYLSEVKITDFFNIVHIRNRGVVFGMLSDVQNEKIRLVLNFISVSLIESIRALIIKSKKLMFQIKEKNRRREEELSRFPCVSCKVFEQCSEISKNLKELEDKLNLVLRNNPDEVEKEFRRTIEFLRFMGYLDKDYMLTEKGWEASNLKTSRSIYIFELLKKGFFGKDPATFAATLAMLLSETKPPFIKPPQNVEREVEKIYHLELKFGITPKFRPSEIVVRRKGRKFTILAFLDGKIYSAVKIWASGGDIHSVQEKCGIDIGDLARVVSQTVEVLRQIEKIYEFSYISQVAISKIYRSPITDFVD